MQDTTSPNDDPVASLPPQDVNARRVSHRYSAFDTHLFANYQIPASPATAKRALEAHLSETDRRLEEASRLGTALIQQREELVERLREVEERHDRQELGPELRQKLVEVQREYNELGRDSARAFLSYKSRGSTADESQSASSVLDGKVINIY